MGEAILTNVFLDTNVLINDFFYRYKQKKESRYSSIAIQFLKANPKITLYIASFSLIQLVSTLDKAKVSKTDIAIELKRIISRYKLVDLTANDFQKALDIDYKDTEDAIQYTLCRKVRCFYIVTENIKDFRVCLGIIFY
jgi:predicted nucleic acid-binding protein